MLPIYHLFLFAISPKDQAMGGQMWPDHPTLHNFEVVFRQQHHYLNYFWLQMWNSLFIAVVAGLLTLVVATGAAFAISRLRVRGGRTVMNMALFTYFIPAAFPAVPMYKTMGNYGLLNSQWALILAMVTIASPYCISVLKQASDKLPYELDEAARMDGASPLQLFRLVYLPLMVLPIYASMEKLDFRLLEAAYDLYATRFAVLRRIILPLVKPGVIAGSILVFIPAIGAYVTPRVLGGGKNMMMGNLIELQFGQGRNWPLGAALSICLLLIVTAALIFYIRASVAKDISHGH
jgi:ABC-type spermidine/putrescine transport system permease subunit I